MNENNYDKEGLIDITTIIDAAWQGIKKLWWVVLVIIIFFSGFSFFRASYSYVPFYVASATFTVTVDESSSYYNQDAASQLSTTFPYIISSTVLSNLIAEDLGLTYVPASISASVVEDTNLFTLKATGSDPEMVYKVLQATIENYPKVSEFVVGSTKMELLEETGVPKLPYNETRSQYSLENAKRGALKGTAIGIALIVLYVATRRTIRKPEDLTRRINIKYIGAIPEVKEKKRRKQVESKISIENRKAPQGYIEAIRTLRTRIERAAMEREMKTILITSAAPGEGKTTTAYNLALSMSLKGKTVALIDCDLRHPSVMNTIGVYHEGPGLTELLKKKASLSECLLRKGDSTLYVMPAGERENASAELLSSEDMKSVIDKLREEVDYIILDTAPAALLADASIIAAYADAAVFVVKQDHAKVHSILEGVERLSESNIELLGFVLNGAKEGIVSYGYGSYSRYGAYGKYGRYGKYSTKHAGHSREE